MRKRNPQKSVAAFHFGTINKKNMYHNDTTMTHAAPSEETKTSEEKQQRESTEIEELETKQREIEANLFRLRWRGEKTKENEDSPDAENTVKYKIIAEKTHKSKNNETFG